MEIINSEHQLLIDASKIMESSFHTLFNQLNYFSFSFQVKNEGWLFISFLAHIRKHHMLALLSTIRRHHVQTVMNLRQILESE